MLYHCVGSVCLEESTLSVRVLSQTRQLWQITGGGGASLHDDLSDDAAGGGGVALQLVLGLLLARAQLRPLPRLQEVSLLPQQLVRDVVAGVGVGQPGHVAVRGVWNIAELEMPTLELVPISAKLSRFAECMPPK